MICHSKRSVGPAPQAVTITLRWDKSCAYTGTICHSLLIGTSGPFCCSFPPLQEKRTDDLQRMARGDEGVFDKLFTEGCPKFITAVPPAYDNPNSAANTAQEVRGRETCGGVGDEKGVLEGGGRWGVVVDELGERGGGRAVITAIPCA